MDRAEQERDFYYEKLMDVELLCQRPEFADNPLKEVVEKFLYAVEGKPDMEEAVAAALAKARPQPAAVASLKAVPDGAGSPKSPHRAVLGENQLPSSPV